MCIHLFEILSYFSSLFHNIVSFICFLLFFEIVNTLEKDVAAQQDVAAQLSITYV